MTHTWTLGCIHNPRQGDELRVRVDGVAGSAIT